MPPTRQPDLFAESPAVPSARDLRITPQGRAPLSKDQQTFNRLLVEVQKLRDTLAAWREFEHEQQQRVVRELVPLIDAMAQHRRALILQCADLLGSKSAGNAAQKTERRQLTGLLVDLCEVHLSESAEDAEIVEVHDRYAGRSFAKRQAEQWQQMQDDARDIFGVDLADAPEGDPAEALFEAVRRAAEAEPQAGAENDASPGRGRRNARAGQREAERAAAAAAAREVSQSVRDVYRKLASALHPDRAGEDAERARRHALMQRVNLAYEGSDLLGLLTLQLEVEQIDRDHLATLSETRLRHYNQVLREQTRELKQEIAEITDQFRLAMAQPVRKLTPAAVEQDFARCVVAARGDLAEFCEIAEALRDPRARRQWLREYTRDRQEAADHAQELETLLGLEDIGIDDVLSHMFSPPDPPRARARRKAKGRRERR